MLSKASKNKNGHMMKASSEIPLIRALIVFPIRIHRYWPKLTRAHGTVFPSYLQRSFCHISSCRRYCCDKCPHCCNDFSTTSLPVRPLSFRGRPRLSTSLILTRTRRRSNGPHGQSGTGMKEHLHFFNTCSYFSFDTKFFFSFSVMVGWDYKFNFTPGKADHINDLHQRVANRILHVCQTNG